MNSRRVSPFTFTGTMNEAVDGSMLNADASEVTLLVMDTSSIRTLSFPAGVRLEIRPSCIEILSMPGRGAARFEESTTGGAGAWADVCVDTGVVAVPVMSVIEGE